MSKVQESHLKRPAYIYVRQSSPGQVRHNVESGRRQYALTDRARQLGWDHVHVIDDDQGRSASGHIQRRGFETLLDEVCQGQVGAVFVVEGARLARNGHEWHRRAAPQAAEARAGCSDPCAPCLDSLVSVAARSECLAVSDAPIPPHVAPRHTWSSAARGVWRSSWRRTIWRSHCD
jgi:hypothetical protein